MTRDGVAWLSIPASWARSRGRRGGSGSILAIFREFCKIITRGGLRTCGAAQKMLLVLAGHGHAKPTTRFGIGRRRARSRRGGQHGQNCRLWPNVQLSRPLQARRGTETGRAARPATRAPRRRRASPATGGLVPHRGRYRRHFEQLLDKIIVSTPLCIPHGPSWPSEDPQWPLRLAQLPMSPESATRRRRSRPRSACRRHSEWFISKPAALGPMLSSHGCSRTVDALRRVF